MRDGSERFEYIKQPHVIALMIICGLVIIGAIYTAGRRIADINSRADLGAETACFEQVGDADLCKFVAVSQGDGFTNYVSVTTETGENSLRITTLEVEKPDYMRSIATNGASETGAYIMMGANAYAKDYSDGYWATYTDPDYLPAADSVTYDFLSADSQDIVEFRDNYRREGSEPCGDLTCFKYRVSTPDEPETVTYIWFDDQDYLIRRYQSSASGTSMNIQYSYRPVAITAPSPTKQVDEEAFTALLGDE